MWKSYFLHSRPLTPLKQTPRGGGALKSKTSPRGRAAGWGVKVNFLKGGPHECLGRQDFNFVQTSTTPAPGAI